MNIEKPERKRKIVMLTITERCNLDCIYCYEKLKSNNVMELQVAKDTIEYEFNYSDEFDEIEIDFFGGEPTINKKLIVEIVEWTLSKKFKKPFLFFMETNGTLVHGDFQDWLIENKNYVHVGLSLDGTPDTHNKNRSNSYSKIDINFFLNNYPCQGVRMTIHNNTISNLFNDIVHLHNLGFSKIDAFFAYGINWNIEKIKNVLKVEFEKLSNYYLANPALKECSLFDLSLPNILNKDEKLQKWCGTGTSMVSIAIDGKKYPCQTFQPNTTDKPIELKNIDFSKIENFNDPECSNCILENICPNCYGINYIKYGDILKRDKQFCTVMKIRALAVSYHKANQIEKGLTKMNKSETYQTILAIKTLQSEFIDL